MAKVYKYGDNIDTDVIIPARYLNAPQKSELAKHCMEDIDLDFAKKTVQQGDFIVAGANFGCGFLPGACAHRHPGLRREVRHCQKLCPHFLPQRHQYRLPDHGVPGGGGGHCGQ